MLFYNTSVAIAFGTVALILLVAFPFLILLEQPDYPTIWTQLAIPTWLTKVFYVLFPPLGLVAICDMMITLRPERMLTLLVGQSASMYGLELLFNDIDGYHSKHSLCSNAPSNVLAGPPKSPAAIVSNPVLLQGAPASFNRQVVCSLQLQARTQENVATNCIALDKKILDRSELMPTPGPNTKPKEHGYPELEAYRQRLQHNPNKGSQVTP